MLKQLSGVLGVFALLLPAAHTLAQGYPERPIRVIAAQGVGSSLDTITRILTPRMSEILGQQLVVDNRGGAGGTLGIEAGSRATPDGYTLLVGAPSSMIISQFTYRKLNFDPIKDFEPISMTVNAPGVLVVHPSVPVNTVKELIALANQQPGKLNMASAGVGSSSHLSGVMFASMAAIDTVHVPYKGGGAMSGAVVSGEAHWAIGPAAALAGHIQAKRLKAIAISTTERSPMMPDLPTIHGSGVPGYEYTSWNGFFAPRGTPRAIIERVHSAILKTLAAPQVKKLFANQGLVPEGSATPGEFRQFFLTEFKRIEQLVRIAGLKPEN
jgi:tripartite-type tricarboxylate transporter receptor subunit TctC